HPANGTLFPQPWVLREGAARRMDQAVGGGWRLVLRDQAPLAFELPALPVMVQVLYLGSPGLTETEGVLGQWFARHDCAAALVRPDHYVYGVAANAAELAAMLNRLAREITPV
ncbi:MAG TPA: FAD-binding monooxygenase, partial [Burkholderiales bacterium]|nr:FAD-binding monooxygenase [Burkholderiales bacterium]